MPGRGLLRYQRKLRSDAGATDGGTQEAISTTPRKRCRTLDGLQAEDVLPGYTQSMSNNTTVNVIQESEKNVGLFEATPSDRLLLP
ncbi:hypothetical protein FH972_021843 [Carpinus fangiana]|uniref:Uncharacterized protein n=1 Tax=Carpinus fangiana TaxID=176857 RepID=A0A5N6KSL9_9ROSI|nr:hypothetical protein FH972_021843 [Carpinus fangiana]